MSRLLRPLLALLLAALLAAPAAAQDSGWQALLYESATGTLTRVDAAGQIIDAQTLPTLPGYDRYPGRVALTPDGLTSAYVVYSGLTFQSALLISRGGVVQTSLPLGVTFSDSTEFLPAASLFDPAGERLALGYSFADGGWAITIINLISGAIEQSLRSDQPEIALLGLQSSPGETPVVRRFDRRTVSFNLVLAGSDQNAFTSGYDWNIDTNQITSNAVYLGLSADTYAPTGETIIAQQDRRLEGLFDSFVMGQDNTLQVYDPLLGARFPFYNAVEASLSQPRFIQNGELILADSVDFAERYAWVVLGRDGRLVGALPASVVIDQALGVADGFIYLTGAFLPGAATLVYVNTRDGLDAGVPVWTSAPGAQLWLVWAGGGSLSAQTAFVPWAALAEPVFAPGIAPAAAPVPDQPLLVNPADIAGQGAPVGAGDVTAQAAPVSPRALAVGMAAVVNTTEGDQLNLREGPGLNFPIIAKLGDQAAVTLMEGPRAVDGFTWWRVRTASGISGWCVESVVADGARLPTLLPG